MPPNLRAVHLKANRRRKTIKQKKRTGNPLPGLKIKPSADERLFPIFSRIGVPDKTPFKPDSFQLKARTAIRRTDCLVSSPTGSGKTWIAMEAIDYAHQQGGKCWYASPLKALSNSKYQEFSDYFGHDKVGILTGDRKENGDAPIIVGTTEVLRNQLYDTMHLGKNLPVDLVILDEAHFLGDEDRGVVWEEIMIYLPVRIHLLLLSATIGNAQMIAGWLKSIRLKECVVIEERGRPVPLYPLFFHPSGRLLPLKNLTGIDKKVEDYLKHKGSFPKIFPYGAIIRVLRKYQLLPAIFFLKSRSDCNAALKNCLDELNPDEINLSSISRRVNGLIDQYSYLGKHRQLRYVKDAAIAAHHSGQLPAWKLMVEHLMNDGLLDAVFATSTVAAGINCPARSIIFLNSDKFNGHQFSPLNSTEFHQMTGRAGRRGMDKIGFALIVPGKFNDVRLMANLFSSPPEDVLSQLKVNFSMVLNLLLSHQSLEIKEIFQKSFATYLNRSKNSPGLNHTLWNNFLKHLKFLQEEGFVSEHGELTEDGRWASRLRIDQPIIIAECFRKGVFPDSDPALLAAMVAPFVRDRETNFEIEKIKISKQLFKRFDRMERALIPVLKRKKKRGFKISPISLQPAIAIFAWANGKQWEKTLKLSNLTEGDFAMLIFRTVDCLRQIASLKQEFPEIAGISLEAIDLILREPVLD